MKFTLKNLLLLNTVFLSVFTFDLDCMNDSDSAPKLKRLDSMMKLPNYDDDEERDYFPRLSLDEYFTIAYKFFKANGKSEVEAERRIYEIRGKFEEKYETLRRLEKNFGSKIYPEFLSSDYFSHIFKRIESIDVSPSFLNNDPWEKIKNWLHSNKNYIPNFEELAGDLEEVMKIKKENFKLEENKTEEIYGKLVKEHDPSLWGHVGRVSDAKLFCMGPKIDDVTKRFFKEKLIKFLKSSLENFQRVMLLYFAFNMQIYAGKRTMVVTKATEPGCSEDGHAVLDETSKIDELPEILKNLPIGNIMITGPLVKFIDISFPSLMNFAVGFTKTNALHLCGLQEDPKLLKIEEPLNLGHLLFLYKKFRDQIDRIITGKGLDNVPDNKSGLRKDDIEDLVEAIVGIDSIKYKELKDKGTDEKELKSLASAKLFNISELNETDLEKFKNSLKEILANASGFQLILSLITADTINRISNPFYGEVTPVSVRINYMDEGISYKSRNSSECLVKIVRQERAKVYFHELSHVYHDMINFRNSNSLVVFSILNNPLFDTCDRFFPMLNKSEMIRSLPSTKIDDITEQEVLKIIVKAIENGFGNVVFKYMMKLKEHEMDIKNLFKNKEFVRTCVYLNELLLPEYGGGDRRWISNEEMLTIQGFFPILIDGKWYIIVDRQHEQIYEIRDDQACDNRDYDGLMTYLDKSTYTFHDYIKEDEAQKTNPEFWGVEPRPQKSKYQYINIDDLKNYKGPTVGEVFGSYGIPIE